MFDPQDLDPSEGKAFSVHVYGDRVPVGTNFMVRWIRPTGQACLIIYSKCEQKPNTCARCPTHRHKYIFFHQDFVTVELALWSLHPGSKV